MSIDLWIGSATTLAGAFLGGVISFALSRQQAYETRRQRLEEWRRQNEQARMDRRFSCYSEFITRARAYRNALRFLPQGELDQADIDRMNDLAAAADATSSLVFLVMESSATYDACRSVLRAMQECQSYISQPANDLSCAAQLEGKMAASLRGFQAASRDELGVVGVERSSILGIVAEDLAGSSKSEAV